MNADGKSDVSIVPSTRVNNAGLNPAAESGEGRDTTKGNVDQPNRSRALTRTRPVKRVGRRS